MPRHDRGLAAIASDQSLESFGDTPILQVVSSDMKFESNSPYQGSVSSKTHFTHLRLADGSNDQIVGRLRMQLAFEGKSLQCGDVIMLTSFTPLRSPPSGPEKPQRSPAIIIHNFSRVGFQNVAENLNDPTAALDASPTQCVPATTSTVMVTKKRKVKTD